MPTTFCTPIDNVSTTLASAFTAGGSTLAVASGQGSLFGSPSAGSPVRVTVVATAALDTYGRITDRTKVCVFKATGRTSDTLTGVTLESGTSQNFATGDVIAVLNTAQTEADQHTAINTLESSVVYTTGDQTVAGTKTFSTAPVLASLTGILKASTGVLSAAAAGTDYLSPTGNGSGLTSLNASAIASGTVAVARGGTGVTTTPTNGQLLIGNGTGYTVANLTAGSNITITNGGGSITIAGAAGLTVGNAVSGGAANRVLYENSSQNLAVSAGLAYDGTILSLTGGINVSGSPNGYSGSEVQLNGSGNTSAISTTFGGGGSSACLMLFNHRGTTGGIYSFRTNNVSKMDLDASGNLTIAGGLTQSGIGTFTAGVDVTGGPVGYGGGEIRFSSAFSPGNAIYTVYTGSPTIYFDHRGTGNTGTFNWRNGTNAGTTLMSLSSAGLLTTLGGHVPASTSGAPGSAGATGEIRVDPTNNKIWMYNGSAWKSVLLS